MDVLCFDESSSFIIHFDCTMVIEFQPLCIYNNDGSLSYVAITMGIGVLILFISSM